MSANISDEVACYTDIEILVLAVRLDLDIEHFTIDELRDIIDARFSQLPLRTNAALPLSVATTVASTSTVSSMTFSSVSHLSTSVARGTAYVNPFIDLIEFSPPRKNANSSFDPTQPVTYNSLDSQSTNLSDDVQVSLNSQGVDEHNRQSERHWSTSTEGGDSDSSQRIKSFVTCVRNLSQELEQVECKGDVCLETCFTFALNYFGFKRNSNNLLPSTHNVDLQKLTVEKQRPHMRDVNTQCTFDDDVIRVPEQEHYQMMVSRSVQTDFNFDVTQDLCSLRQFDQKSVSIGTFCDSATSPDIDSHFHVTFDPEDDWESEDHWNGMSRIFKRSNCKSQNFFTPADANHSDLNRDLSKFQNVHRSSQPKRKNRARKHRATVTHAQRSRFNASNSQKTLKVKNQKSVLKSVNSKLSHDHNLNKRRIGNERLLEIRRKLKRRIWFKRKMAILNSRNTQQGNGIFVDKFLKKPSESSPLAFQSPSFLPATFKQKLRNTQLHFHLPKHPYPDNPAKLPYPSKYAGYWINPWRPPNFAIFSEHNVQGNKNDG